MAVEQLLTPSELAAIEAELLAKNEALSGQQERIGLQTFHSAVAASPAYCDYIEAHGIDPQSIATVQDLNRLPITDKYTFGNESLVRLVPDMNEVYAVSYTSGSSGRPIPIPRTREGDSAIQDNLFQTWNSMWDIATKKTLNINGWALGPTSAGTLVDQAMRNLAAQPDSRMMVVSPSGDVRQMVEALYLAKELRSSINPEAGAPVIDQVILQGYPPSTIKALNKLREQGVDLKELNIHLYIGGESHSVEWVEALQHLLGTGENDLTRVISVLGTSEAGMIATDTQLSVMLRLLANQDKAFAQDLFGTTEVVPMLFQTFPSRFIESVDGEMVVTSPAGIPCVRYNFHDQASLLSMKQVFEIARDHGYDPLQLLQQKGFDPRQVFPFGFMAHYGRTDGVASIDGANIYPANIEPILVNDLAVKLGLTSFMLDVNEDTGNMNRQLTVHIELEEGRSPEAIDRQDMEALENLIIAALLASNGDYRVSHSENSESAIPLILLHAYQQGVFATNNGKTKEQRIAKR